MKRKNAYRITLARIAEIRAKLEENPVPVDAYPRPYVIVDRQEAYELLALAELALGAGNAGGE
jgi:hypothetical protein